MKSETLHKLQKEVIILLSICIASVVVFKLLFFRQDALTVARVVAAFIWLFVVPGYALMLSFHERLSFPVRLGLGICVAGALLGLAAYYLGIIGIRVQFSRVIVPLAAIIIGCVALFCSEKKTAGNVNTEQENHKEDS